MYSDGDRTSQSLLHTTQVRKCLSTPSFPLHLFTVVFLSSELKIVHNRVQTYSLSKTGRDNKRGAVKVSFACRQLGR